MEHKLLLRQIKRFLQDKENIPLELDEFLSAVNEAYYQRDDDYSLLEHAMDVLSEEVHEKNSRIEWLSRFPDENPHTVLRISKKGRLDYANPASQILLKTFNMEVKKDVPKYWKYIVEIAMAKKKNETVEMEVGQQFYSFTFSPVEYEGYVNVYGYDISGRKLAENYLIDQNNILGSLAADQNLQTILDEICLKVEKYTDGLMSSILLVDKSGKFLHYGSAPSLPKSYIEKTRKVYIGKNQGSCGSTAYFKSSIISEDISKDSRWTKHKDLPLSFNLQSC